MTSAAPPSRHVRRTPTSDGRCISRAPKRFAAVSLGRTNLVNRARPPAGGRPGAVAQRPFVTACLLPVRRRVAHARALGFHVPVDPVVAAVFPLPVAWHPELSRRRRVGILEARRWRAALEGHVGEHRQAQQTQGGSQCMTMAGNPQGRQSDERREPRNRSASRGYPGRGRGRRRRHMRPFKTNGDVGHCTVRGWHTPDRRSGRPSPGRLPNLIIGALATCRRLRLPEYRVSRLSAFPDWRITRFPNSMAAALTGLRPAHS